jgi:hypothetical protein
MMRTRLIFLSASFIFRSRKSHLITDPFEWHRVQGGIAVKFRVCLHHDPPLGLLNLSCHLYARQIKPVRIKLLQLTRFLGPDFFSRCLFTRNPIR